jgi:hypothetical protein
MKMIIKSKWLKSYPHYNPCPYIYLSYNINTMITAPIGIFDANKGSFLF